MGEFVIGRKILSSRYLCCFAIFQGITVGVGALDNPRTKDLILTLPLLFCDIPRYHGRGWRPRQPANERFNPHVTSVALRCSTVTRRGNPSFAEQTVGCPKVGDVHFHVVRYRYHLNVNLNPHDNGPPGTSVPTIPDSVPS